MPVVLTLSRIRAVEDTHCQGLMPFVDNNNRALILAVCMPELPVGLRLKLDYVISTALSGVRIQETEDPWSYTTLHFCATSPCNANGHSHRIKEFACVISSLRPAPRSRKLSV